MKILVGFDPFYPNSALIDRTILDAEAHNAQVILIASFRDGKEATSEVMAKAQAELDMAQERLRDHSIFSETHILVQNQSPGEDIVAYAEENAIDEIIVQVRKMSKLGKLITGSTAQHVILNAPCSVVAVRSAEE